MGGCSDGWTHIHTQFFRYVHVLHACVLLYVCMSVGMYACMYVCMYVILFVRLRE